MSREDLTLTDLQSGRVTVKKEDAPEPPCGFIKLDIVLKILIKKLARRHPPPLETRHLPPLDSLRGDSRFANLLRRMRF